MKIKKLLLALLFAVSSLASCNNNNTSIKSEEVDDYKLYLNETFNSVKDLSDAQGYRNWYYYCGDTDDNSLSLMTFNDYYGRWCSKYQTLFYSTYMWGSFWLPEDQQGYGIGMGFKAPATGKVHVSCMVRLLAEERFNSGDGVVFSITDINGEPYDGGEIKPRDGGKDFTYEFDTNIAKDNQILFMLYPNNSNQNDFTDVNITINYVEG